MIDINHIILTRFMGSHVISEIFLVSVFIYLCLKYGFFEGIFGLFAILGVHEAGWIVSYVIHGYPYPEAFFMLGIGIWSFWSAVVFVIMLIKKWKTFSAKQRKGILLFMFGVSITWILWLSIGLPVYYITTGPTQYYNVIWVNLLSQISWIFAGLWYCVTHARFNK